MRDHNHATVASLLQHLETGQAGVHGNGVQPAGQQTRASQGPQHQQQPQPQYHLVDPAVVRHVAAAAAAAAAPLPYDWAAGEAPATGRAAGGSGSAVQQLEAGGGGVVQFSVQLKMPGPNGEVPGVHRGRSGAAAAGRTGTCQEGGERVGGSGGTQAARAESDEGRVSQAAATAAAEGESSTCAAADAAGAQGVPLQCASGTGVGGQQVEGGQPDGDEDSGRWYDSWTRPMTGGLLPLAGGRQASYALSYAVQLHVVALMPRWGAASSSFIANWTMLTTVKFPWRACGLHVYLAPIPLFCTPNGRLHALVDRRW